MSEKAAVATCVKCSSTLQDNWNVCPQCGTSTSLSSAGSEARDSDLGGGRPIFSMVPDAPCAGIPFGTGRLLAEGERLKGQYEIIKALGAGGFGEVYHVRDLALDRDLALKVVVVDGRRTEIAEAQIVQEFAIQEKINERKHIIKGYDPRPCQHKGLSLLLLPMELADGGSLREWFAQNRDVDARREEGLELFKQACLGVKAIHEAENGAVHLDIKPENILIANGTAKVSDFGIGRFSGSGFENNPDRLVRQGMGTPMYMSPEQFRANRQKDIAPPSDIYSLGIVLYELLDGRPPFDGTREELEDKHRNDLPTPLTGPAERWWPIVNRCLRKRSTDRYKSVGQLLKDLDRAAQGVALTVDVSCPACGRINDNDVRRDCENCGADLSMHFCECPQCSRINRRDVQMCNGCGYAVAAHFQRAEQRKRVSQLKDSDPAAAIELLETMIKENPSEEEAAMVRELRSKLRQLNDPVSQAQRFVEAGEIEEAIGVWQTVLKVFPRHRVALEQTEELETLLASVNSRESAAIELMDEARFEEASTLLKECLDLVPARKEARNLLDACHRRARGFPRALEQAMDSHDRMMLVEAAKRVSSALTHAPRNCKALDLQMEISQTMERTGTLRQQAQRQLAGAEFDEAERSVRQIEELQSDFEGIGALKEGLTKTRESYRSNIEETRKAYTRKDLDAAVRTARAALATCPEASEPVGIMDSAERDRREALACLETGRKLLESAEFDAVRDEMAKAKALWATYDGHMNIESRLESTERDYGAAMRDARDALERKEFTSGLEFCARALELCPRSEEAENLQGRIEGAREHACERRRRRQEMTAAATRWVVRLAVLGILGAVVVFGGIWLWGWIGETVWPWCHANSTMLLYVLGGFAAVAVIASVIALAVRDEPPSPAGQVWAVIVNLVIVGAILAGLAFAGIWLLGWISEAFWPWCKANQGTMAFIVGTLIMLQTVIHMARGTDIYIELEFKKMFFIPVVSVAVIVILFGILAESTFNASGQSGTAVGFLASILLGAGSVVFACVAD